MVHDPMLLKHLSPPPLHNLDFSQSSTGSAHKLLNKTVLEAMNSECLDKVPSQARVNVMGLSKKILFKHFKQQGTSTNRERFLENFIWQ